MSEVTRILDAIRNGDAQASEDLLPLVYDELRRLAACKLAQERPGHTLNATALVHEAYLRLVDRDRTELWACRRHFFAAAAEAMRRILVENARRRKQLKHGGSAQTLPLDDASSVAEDSKEGVLAIDEALDRLAKTDPQAAEIVTLHFFAGLTSDEIAIAFDASPRTVYRQWAFARAWLHREIGEAR